MTAEQNQRIKAAFESVLDSTPAERTHLIGQLCADDAVVRAEVEALLRAHTEADGFLAGSPFGPLAFERCPAPPFDFAGRRIGVYELQREIGQGGMATVYLAERMDGEYRQQVALKLVSPHGDLGEITRRFKRERQILAALDHPNIARLLDGGTTAEGWPYLVMEYISGVPITQYCRARNLALARRLRLFQTVCAAVAYAHRNLVVHRDIKPSNILVTEDGAVKLLDFGIAKLLAPDAAGESQPTITGLRPMTPEYASPEQLLEETITTATDVYSLGVLLYELLTGAHPHDLKDRPLHEITRIVCEDDPPPPSARVPQLRGDLDNVVLAALRKDPRQRYQTVEQFSEDMSRYLTGETVSARPATLFYRTGKFARRNKTGVTVTVTVLLLLLAGLFITLRQNRLQRYQLYAADMRQAGQDWAEGNLVEMAALLEAHRPGTGSDAWRGFEWFTLWKLLHTEKLVLPHRKWVHSMRYTPDGKTIVTTDWDGRIMLWDAFSGQSLGTFATQPEGVLRMVITPDGTKLVTAHADGWVRIWGLASKQAIAIPPHTVNDQAYLALSPDGKRVSVHHNFQPFQVWDIETAQLVETYPLPPNYEIPVHGPMLYSPDGKLVCLVRRGRHWELWDLAARRSLVRLDPLSDNPLALSTIYPLGHTFSPDGQRYYLSTADRLVRAWDTKSGKLLHVFSGHQSAPKTPAISSDGKLLATTGDDRTMRLWDTATGKLLALTINESQVDEPVFSPDNRSLAAICYLANRVKVWDVRELLASTPPPAFDQVQALALSPDGKTIVAIPVTQNAPAQVNETKRLGKQKHASSEHLSVPALHDVQTGQQIISYETANHRYVGCVDFSADGKLVALCKLATPDGWTPLVDIRETVSGKLVATLKDEAGVIAARFSPDGKTLATAGAGKAVRLWDTSTWRERLSWLNETNKNESIDFTPDSRQLVLGSWDNLITIWDAASGNLL